MIIQAVLLLFILFVLVRIFSRFRSDDITSREFVLWLVFWLLVGVAVLVPKQTDVVANFVGVSRGADLLVYLSILVLFFLAFKILVRLEKIEKGITKIVRHVALTEKPKKE